MKANFISLLVIILMTACSSNEPNYSVKVKLQKLNAKTLYDKDLVYDVLFDSEELNTEALKTKSRLLFLQGIDLFKNKKQPGLAVVKFKSSILVFPDAKTYYELGNALLDTKVKANYEEAIRAYEVAENLGFEPQAQLNFKMACASNQLLLAKNEDRGYWKHWQTIDYLRNFFTKGMLDTIAVAKEPLLKGITDLALYKNLVIDMQASQMAGNNNSLFDLYKRAFTTNVGHFDLPLEKVDMKEYRQSISYDFAKFIPEMENTEFGRGVSNDFYYVGIVKQSESFTAVLYTSVTFTEEDHQPTYTYLVVYDTEGGIISKKMVACQCTPEKIKRCILSGDKVVVEDYKRNWEKPIKDGPFEENTITGHDLLAKATYRIADNGTITEEDVPAHYNDSSIFAKVQ